MRILVVNDLLQGGGVEKLMYDIVMRNHDKHQITILTDKMDKDFGNIYPENVGYIYQMEEDYPEANNKYQDLKNRVIRKKRELLLKKKVKSMNFDLLLCMKESWIMMMALTYGNYIPKKFAWVHTDYKKSYYTLYWFGSKENEVEFMKRFNNVICVSQVILDSIKEVIGDPGNLLVRNNPLNAKEIIEKGKEQLVEIKRNERPLFVTVGRLSVQKGFDILLEVCNLLNAENYEYDVWIVGGGESCNNYSVLHDLENQIYKYNLHNVYLLGAQSNPHKFVKQADWFLSTSRYEGYSYVSQEAIIQGIPVLLTECAGVDELLGSVGGGIVLENSYKGIYYGMKDVIEHPERQIECKANIKFYESISYWEDRWAAIEELFL